MYIRHRKTRVLESLGLKGFLRFFLAFLMSITKIKKLDFRGIYPDLKIVFDLLRTIFYGLIFFLFLVHLGLNSLWVYLRSISCQFFCLPRSKCT